MLRVIPAASVPPTCTLKASNFTSRCASGEARTPVTARLAASQLDEARSFSEYERERKRAELYYAELKRCYDVLCERGIPVPG